MIDTKEITIKKEKETKTSGRFIVEPLPSGYGHTLGSALRRVLYSSLPGAAISEVSFSGISHPFSTIKGVKEDVIELVLNLKKVRFAMSIDGPSEAQIEVTGKGIVTAGDIKTNAGVEVANPDFKLATLSDKSAKLSAKIRIEKGVGYKVVSGQAGSKMGAIPVDSIFSPVTRVVYLVEETRKGREADLDRLVMEITTDGTVTPSDALQKAVEVFISYLEVLRGGKKETAKTAGKAKGLTTEVKKLPLSKLNLASQTLTILTGAGIKSVGGLAKKSREDLLGIKGFGERRVTEVEKELEKLGAALKALPVGEKKEG